MTLLAASILAMAFVVVHGVEIPLEICTTCDCYKQYHYEPTFCSTTNGCGDGSSGVPENVKQIIVDRINMHRRKVAKGQQSDIPAAKRMIKVVRIETFLISCGCDPPR